MSSKVFAPSLVGEARPSGGRVVSSAEFINRIDIRLKERGTLSEADRLKLLEARKIVVEERVREFIETARKSSDLKSLLLESKLVPEKQLSQIVASRGYEILSAAGKEQNTERVKALVGNASSFLEYALERSKESKLSLQLHETLTQLLIQKSAEALKSGKLTPESVGPAVHNESAHLDQKLFAGLKTLTLEERQRFNTTSHRVSYHLSIFNNNLKALPGDAVTYALSLAEYEGPYATALLQSKIRGRDLAQGKGNAWLEAAPTLSVLTLETKRGFENALRTKSSEGLND